MTKSFDGGPHGGVQSTLPAEVYDLYSAMMSEAGYGVEVGGLPMNYQVPRGVIATAIQCFCSNDPQNDLRLELFVNGIYSGKACTIPAGTFESNIFEFEPLTFVAGTVLTLSCYSADITVSGIKLMVFATKLQ